MPKAKGGTGGGLVARATSHSKAALEAARAAQEHVDAASSKFRVYSDKPYATTAGIRKVRDAVNTTLRHANAASIQASESERLARLARRQSGERANATAQRAITQANLASASRARARDSADQVSELIDGLS